MPSNKLLKQFETKQTRFRSTWLKNATRSVGITMNNVLSDVAPNTVEIASSTNEIARTVLGTLVRGKSGIEKVDTSLAKYSRIGQSAIKNALNSIKTGKFGEADYGFMDMGGGDDSGFSFGDDDYDSSLGTAQIAGLSSVADQINRQSIAQIKTAQANMDTMISINSARMFQTQQISSEILNHITNMENSLASIVQFNNETMLKFVQASMGYYEKTGAALAGDKRSEFEMPEFRRTHILNNNRGGINVGKYKEYVKGNIQKKLDESGMGLVLNEDTLQMLASDPVGFAMQMAGSALVNRVAGKHIRGIEDRLSSALPAALMSLTKLSGSKNPMIKMIGDIFGLRSEEKRSNMNDIKVNKGPMPFDGETKHAITSVITHELRNQTGYLKVIADHFDHNADEKMRGAREFYNERTGKYEKGMDIDLNIAKNIEEGVIEAFKSTKFGAELTGMTEGIENVKDKKEMERAVNDLYMEMMNSNIDDLSIGQIMQMIQNLGVTGSAKKLLNKKIKMMADANQTAFKSASIGKLRARESYNDRIQNIRDNAHGYYLEESGFLGLEGEELEKYLAKTLKRGYGSANKIQAADLIRITQDPDYFEQMRREGKLNGLLDKLDKATVADYQKLAKKGVKAADKKYQQIREQILSSEDYKIAADAVRSGKSGISNRARAYADEIGGSLSDSVARLSGGLKNGTGMLGRFIFGDQTKGTKGLFDSIADSFNKGLKEADPNLEMSDGKKAVTMGGIGALTGAALAKLGFLPALLSSTGPIGGAVAGLTLAIAGAGPMFKRALFGGDVEEFEDDKGNKYTHKTKGLVGRIGTTLEVNLINPIKTAAVNAIQTTALNVEHGILVPFKYLASFAAKRLAKTAGNVFSFIGRVGSALTDENSFINRMTGGMFKAGTKAIGGIASKGIDFATSAGGAIMNVPGNILGAALSILDPELAADFDAERTGYKTRKRALKTLNRNRKQHDKNAQIIAKYTNGEYGEDTDEARAYLKRVNPSAYEKYFGTDKKGKAKNIGTIDEEKGMRKLLNESGGKNITIDPSQYDAASQTAIYSARMVVMQEQVLRALLGEKVEYAANSDATLSKGGHDKKSKRDEKRAKSKKWQNKAKGKYAHGDDLSEDEQAYIDKLSDEEKEELGFQREVNQERNFAKSDYDAHKGGDNGFFTRLWHRTLFGIRNSKIERKLNRHEDEKFGFRKRKKQDEEEQSGGEGFGNIARYSLFGGRGPLSKTIEDIKEERKERKEEKWKDNVLNAIKGVKKETKEHKEGWASIFSKKGLITGALILAAPFLLKTIPKVFNFLKEQGPAIITKVTAVLDKIEDILSSIGNGLESMLGDWLKNLLPKGAKDPDENKELDENNGDTKTTGQKIGDAVIDAISPWDENGEIDNTSSAKVGVYAQIARIAAQSGHYASLGFKHKNLVKGQPIRNIGRKIYNAVHANRNAQVAIGKTVEGVKSIPKSAKEVLRGSSLKGKAVEYTDDVMDSAVDLMAAAQHNGSVTGATLAKNAAGYSDEVMDSAVDLMAAAQREGMENVSKAAQVGAKSTSSGIFGKVKNAISKFYDDILGKFTAKFGSTAPSLGAFAREKIIQFCEKHWGKIGDKIAAKLTAGTTAATFSAGLSELAFATIGAINGVTGAAKLFHVPSDMVDGTMRAISGIMGGLAGTTIGGIVDLVLQIFYAITGIDVLNGIATTLYTAIKKLSGKEADIEKLGKAQAALQTEYDEYKNTEIRKAWETQVKAGIIDENVSLNEFIAGVNDGTYHVKIDSKADYTAKNHGALSDKILQGIGKAGKKAYDVVTGGPSEYYVDANGNTYTKNSDGQYDVKDINGNALGAVSKSAIPATATKKSNTKLSIADAALTVVNPIAGGINIYNKLKKKNQESQEKSVNKSAELVEAATKRLDKFNKNKETTHSIYLSIYIASDNIFRDIENPLQYYKYNGKDFDLYTGSGELVKEHVKTVDDMDILYGSGLVLKDSLSGKTGLSNNYQVYTSAGYAVQNAWNNTANKLKEVLGKATSDPNSTTTTSTGTEAGGEGRGRGGRGTYYSQNDSRWRDASYGGDTTMGESGCGPTAVAMAMSDATGRKFTPTQMAGLAQATGDRDSTGTNWNFVNHAASIAGVPSAQVYGPSAGYIGSQLAAGNELILSGRTGGYGYGGYGSAYTPAGHYIVGTGIDRNGIVSYKDPLTGGMGRIPLGALAAETGSSWRFGGHGRLKFGGRGLSRYVFGGRGSKVPMGALGYRMGDAAAGEDPNGIYTNGTPTYKINDINSIPWDYNPRNHNYTRNIADYMESTTGEFYKAGQDPLEQMMSKLIVNKDRKEVTNEDLGLSGEPNAVFSVGLGPTATTTSNAGGLPMASPTTTTTTTASTSTSSNSGLASLSIAEPITTTAASKATSTPNAIDPVTGGLIMNKSTATYNPFNLVEYGVNELGVQLPEKASFNPFNLVEFANNSATNAAAKADNGIDPRLAARKNGTDPFAGQLAMEARAQDLKDQESVWTFNSNEDAQCWLPAVIKAKQAIADAGCGYSYGGRANVKVDGETYTIRNDCSGFVCFALVLAGLFNKTYITAYTSETFNNGSWLKNLNIENFFTKLEPTPNNVASLQRGDILCYGGHVEVFCSPDEHDNLVVYNVGSDKSANNPGPTVSGHKLGQLRSVYRITSDAYGYGSAADYNAKHSGDATIAGNDRGEAKFDGDWFGLIGDYLGEMGSRLFKGDWKNTDYTDIKDKHMVYEDGTTVASAKATDKLLGTTSTTGTTGVSGAASTGTTSKGTSNPSLSSLPFAEPIPSKSTTASSTGTSKSTATSSADTSSNASLAGLSFAEPIPENTATDNPSLSSLSFAEPVSGDSAKNIMYKKLRSLGVTPVATAGILGNFQAESGIKSNRFEGDFSGIAKNRGGYEGIFQDHEHINEYTQALIANMRSNGSNINEGAYIVDGNYYPGIGLAQWTGTRGKGLMDYAASKGKHWGDLETQTEYMVNEFNTSDKWRNMLAEMNEAGSPTVAAQKFLDLYEHNGKDGWHKTAQESTVHVNDRVGAAEAIFQEFGGAGYGGRGRGASIHNRNYVVPKMQGGRGGLVDSLGSGLAKMFGGSTNADTSEYGGATVSDSYVYTSTTDLTQPYTNSDKLLLQLIDVTKKLLEVETGSNTKLDMLEGLESLGGNYNNTNLMVNGGSNNIGMGGLDTASSKLTSQGSSRQSKRAHEIALQM